MGSLVSQPFVEHLRPVQVHTEPLRLSRPHTNPTASITATATAAATHLRKKQSNWCQSKHEKFSFYTNKSNKFKLLIKMSATLCLKKHIFLCYFPTRNKIFFVKEIKNRTQQDSTRKDQLSSHFQEPKVFSLLQS